MPKKKLVTPGSKQPPAVAEPIEEVDSNTVLDILFPEREVPIKEIEDLIIVVRPLSLKDLPKVSDAFGVLMRYAMAGYDPIAIAAKGFGEIAKLIPYCINVPPESIPASYGPEVMEIIVEQNITDDVIKKWTALVGKRTEIAEEKGVLNESQGEKQLTKKT
jgi:hypothetical protein